MRTRPRRASAPAGVGRGRRVRPNLLLGAFLVGALLVAAALAPLLAPHPPNLLHSGSRLQAPSGAHPFGTDDLGRDVLSRVLHGARLALRLSLLTVALSSLPGVALGLLTGYRRGWLDLAVARLMDAWLAFPGLLLAIVLLARLGPSLTTTILALGIAGVPSFYRLARGCTIAAAHEPYVLAARAIGATEGRILLRHVLPNVSASLTVLVTLRLGTALLAGSSLSFVGLGAQPPAPEWGTMLSTAKDYLGLAWWLALFPGTALALSVLGFNLLGDGLRDVADPRTS